MVMVKYKGRAIVGVVIICILAAAWFYGGNFNRSSEMLQANIQSVEAENIQVLYETENSSEAQAEQSIMNLSEAQVEQNTEQDAGIPNVNQAEQNIEQADAQEGSFTVTLTVRADTILNNMNLLDREKHELVPLDGVIFPKTEVRAYDGESVFNVLQREMRRASIHMAFRNTPVYNSAYVMAIGNLFEFDAGELSGWNFRVNGEFPNKGSSRVLLSPGDTIEWLYTCDLGRDLGELWLRGGQLDD